VCPGPTCVASYFFRGLESLGVTGEVSKKPDREDVAMHVLMVCYGLPADPAAFDAYYTSTHVPLAEKIPGVASFSARHCASLDGSAAPYHLIAELGFPSREALNAALSSPEGQAAAGDLANFATGGATMFVAYD
jgi:uncharacterized protein (TIGR02118 family)